MKIKVIMIGLCVGLSNLAPARAAEYGEKMLFRNMASISIDASVRTWSLGSDLTIAQRAFPMSLALPVADRALFTLSAVPASVGRGAGSITGISDMQFGGSYVMPGENVWLTGAVNLPTGVMRLSEAQTQIAASIAQPALGYTVPSMGHGLNTTLGAAYAASASRLIVFGFGAAVSTKGAYEPVAVPGAAEMKYAPGNEIAANIGIDYRDGMKTNRISADYTVTYYFSDKLNGERFFQSGIKASIVLAGTHTTRTMAHLARLRLETRGRNVTIIDGSEERSPSAHQLSALYTVTKALTNKLIGTAGAELRLLSSDEFPVNGQIVRTGGGTVGLLTAECRYAAASWCTIQPRCSFGIGSVTLSNAALHAVGFDAGIGIRLSL